MTLRDRRLVSGSEERGGRVDYREEVDGHTGRGRVVIKDCFQRCSGGRGGLLGAGNLASLYHLGRWQQREGTATRPGKDS